MTALLGSALTGRSAPADETITLPLDQALRLAEENSPLVRLAAAEMRTTEAADVGASLWLPSNPYVAGYAGPRREIDSSGGPTRRGTQFGIHAEQQLEIFNQRGTRRAVVKEAVAAARFRMAVARNEARARMRAAYLSSALARRQFEAAGKQEELATQLMDGVRARVEEGAASDIDLRLAEVELGQVQRARLEAEQAATLALAPLRLLAGLGPAQPVTLPTQVGTPETDMPPLDALLAAAMEHRAELGELAKTKNRLDAQLSQLSREALPNPTIAGDIQRDLPGQLYTGASLGFPLPVFRRNQGEKAVVRATLGQLTVEQELAARTVAYEVTLAYQNVNLLRKQLETVEKTVLPAAESSVTLLREGWRAGKFDFFRVLAASRALWDARRAQFQILAELWLAIIELDRATGQA